MKIEPTRLLNRDNFLSIQKKIYLNRAEITASVESKKVGLISMIKEGTGWRVESIYSDRTYDKTGRLTSRLFNSIMNLSSRRELEPIEDELSNSLISILSYMERD